MNELAKCSTAIARKARKVHKCYGCYAEIKVGDVYQYTSGVWDEPASFKHCLSCAKVIDNFHLMDENLSCYDGPSFDWGGVNEFLCGFVYSGWHGIEAANDTVKLFNVPLEYAKLIFGEEK